MKNCASIDNQQRDTNHWTHQIWTGDAERLGCISTRSIGTRNRLFYLKLFLVMTVFGKISLFEFEFLNNIRFYLFFIKSMALTQSIGTRNRLFYLKKSIAFRVW